ncbi:MAG: DUF938 domain-containing protein [Rhodospirillaceae bacterium]|jgi:hypothetical protein|nr:DUF938 domain-containing protein [Rhodospirillaceae bacterium]MBT4688408.1 DUF938 domain-containing protein [Rhodospirillaceae bacterium]MBT5084045.1 DUF938 domain-containing protein [Rhodospirillaceae bacterium]MBT5525094.1 DUF938 domain-containing protein [Rhodospirillaceae bacterium]MBT5882142.1 DUF938 domain-containing protein [Rhodospirillaceae bacterium]
MAEKFSNYRHSPSAERNRGPILEVLRTVMPPPGVILDVGAGGGHHCAWYAPEFPAHTWAPSDADGDALAGIDAWAGQAEADNILPARLLDAQLDSWPIDDIADQLVAFFTVNMIHIAPWQATVGMMAAAGRYLPANGIVFLYGPFMRDGRPLTDSDAAFDRSIRNRHPASGLRDLDAVRQEAEKNGLESSQQVDMPAGNLSLIFRPQT